MCFSQLHKSAIDRALRFGLSFALYRDKNSDSFTFICDDRSEKAPISTTTFYAVNWLDKFANRITIADRLTLKDVANYESGNKYTLATPWNESTDKTYYLNSIKKLVEDLRQSKGKTVISRTIAVNTRNNIADLAEKYFGVNKNTYCCLLHTPEIGCWIIASPEILLEADYISEQIQTLALAGTRKISEEFCKWDEKNIQEQKMVCDFITRTLDQLNLPYSVSDCSSIKTNNIEHLATYITSKFNDNNDIITVLDWLNPTPALCGIPRETSINRINNIEQHPRRLYGGYFGYVNDKQFKAIVTLRCAQISQTNACIYAGGGITEASVAELEWDETTLKSQVLANILTKFNHE